MIVAIIAGGAGTRLWPLSTSEYPKHLLTLSGKRSLVQLAYDRAKLLTTPDKIYIVTEISHAHHVKEQISELKDNNFIIEPGRRNTSGCLLAALQRVAKEGDPDEPIAITWADHFVHDVKAFAHAFKVAGRATKKYRLPVFIGVEPSYPTTVLGYIHKAELMPDEDMVYRAAGFKEKPDRELAQKFFDSGEYLLNCGYLVGTLNAFTDAIQADCPDLWQDYQALLATKNRKDYEKVYLDFKGIQLDYVFNELLKNFLTLPGSFDWTDIGVFRDLYDATPKDDDGNCVLGEQIIVKHTSNSYIRNESERPLVVIGMDNIIAVSTPTGTLVARKDLAQLVKDAVGELAAQK
ncbi:MAG TPA: sugar phosphate nucleotidyltransferase [Candidatus Saccharimonadales bacterium]|nr:sugar phosphate nucleotidyltransferase [Candidatus Saccharimonadales bacterium]